jgi:hypothetical protein
LDDLQLAVESALLAHAGTGPAITLEAALAEDRLELRLGPLDEAVLETRLSDSAGAVGLERVLAALADDVELVERDGGAWLRLRKATAGRR